MTQRLIYLYPFEISKNSRNSEKLKKVQKVSIFGLNLHEKTSERKTSLANAKKVFSPQNFPIDEKQNSESKKHGRDGIRIRMDVAPKAPMAVVINH